MGEMAAKLKPDQGEPERHKRFQYSLASLFRLTTIIAILLGISRMFGMRPFFCTMGVLVALGYAFTPLLLFVLLCSLTNLSEKWIVKIEAGVLVLLFALAIALDVVTVLVGEIPGATLLALLLWVPQCVIIGCGFLGIRTGNADRKLRRKALPTELEPDGLDSSERR